MIELPEIKLNRDEVQHIAPRPAIMTFANEVNQSATTQVPVLLLAQSLQVGMSRCEQERIKQALIEAAQDPSGIAARHLRYRLNQMLPPFLKTAKIENIIIRLGAIAAQVPELWALLVEEPNDRATDSSNREAALVRLSALWRKDATQTDRPI